MTPTTYNEALVRIEELEAERHEWKRKFDDAMALLSHTADRRKISTLEKSALWATFNALLVHNGCDRLPLSSVQVWWDHYAEGLEDNAHSPGLAAREAA